MDGGEVDGGEIRRARIVAVVIGLCWGAPMFTWAILASGPVAGLAVLVWAVPVAMMIGIYAVERTHRLKHPWLADRARFDALT